MDQFQNLPFSKYSTFSAKLASFDLRFGISSLIIVSMGASEAPSWSWPSLDSVLLDLISAFSMGGMTNCGSNVQRL